MNRCILMFFVAIVALVESSCKTEPVLPTNDPTPTSNNLQLIADSVYLFSREIYFWDEIRTPANEYIVFKPRDSVKIDEVATAKAVISKIRSTNANDKSKEYSYASVYEEDASTAVVAQTINSYGFYFKAGYTNRKIEPNLRENDPLFAGFFISYVYKDSDAGKKGVQRGWKILRVNGTDMTRISQASVNVLNNMFYYESIKSAEIIFQKPSGENTTVTVGITTFVPNSVLYRDTIKTSTGRIAGYLVYNFFGRFADTKAEIDEAVQYFKSMGINEVIIDLRYNRGGYTQTQNYLANSFAPSSANQQVMYKMHFNSNLQAGNYSMMQKRHAYSKDYYTLPKNTVSYATANTFNTTKLFVIVGSSTASASELFINDLIPYMNNNLIMIGDANTYGKPVGFFPIDFMKKVTIWMVSFEARNKNDGAVPYTGFGPNFRVYDGADKVWGDPEEDCLKAAINLIDGKTVTSAAVSTTPRSATPLFIRQKEIFEHSNLLHR